MKKKLGNGGFSLVELIVVIAIMAILIGVLAPNVFGQLEKAKISKDKQSVDSFATAVAIAYADPDVTKPSTVNYAATGITFASSGSNVEVTSAGSGFSDAVKLAMGYSTVVFESTKFKAFNSIEVSVNATTSKITVTVKDGSSNEICKVTK